jgi:hypothetical protein
MIFVSKSLSIDNTFSIGDALSPWTDTARIANITATAVTFIVQA